MTNTNTATAATKSTKPQNGDILIHKDGSTYRIYRKAGSDLNQIATSFSFNRNRGINVYENLGNYENEKTTYHDAPDFTRRQIEKQGRALVEKYVPAASFAADIWINLHMGWADRVWQRLA